MKKQTGLKATGFLLVGQNWHYRAFVFANNMRSAKKRFREYFNYVGPFGKWQEWEALHTVITAEDFDSTQPIE